MSCHRMALHHPVAYVEVVDVLLHDVVAAEPVEIIPVPHLILHLGKLAACLGFHFGTLIYPHPRVVPVNAGSVNVADSAAVQFVHPAAIHGLVMALEADHHVEFFGFCLGGSFHHTAHAGGIGGHRFFHEHMLASCNAGLKMLWAESRRRGQNHHIHQRDHLLISIETMEAALFGHVHLGGDVHGVAGGPVCEFFRGDGLEAAFDAVFKGIGHGHEFHALAGAQGLHSSTGSAATATNQADTDGVVAVEPAKGAGRQGAGSQHTTGNKGRLFHKGSSVHLAHRGYLVSSGRKGK